MKNFKHIILFCLILLVTISTSTMSSIMNYSTVRYRASEAFTKDKMKLLPIPRDFRNYFILQSIDDTTNVLIGDFIGFEKRFSLIIDRNTDENVDKIIEYTPDNGKYTTPQKPKTELFVGFKETKKQIISGEINKNNYSFGMRSLPILKELLKEGKDIIKTRFGYTVKLFDPDKPSVLLSEFFFNKNTRGRYDLVFTTFSYKIFQTDIVPVIYCSVYCRNSKDPVVKETVDSLLVMTGDLQKLKDTEGKTEKKSEETKPGNK